MLLFFFFILNRSRKSMMIWKKPKQRECRLRRKLTPRLVFHHNSFVLLFVITSWYWCSYFVVTEIGCGFASPSLFFSALFLSFFDIYHRSKNYRESWKICRMKKSKGENGKSIDTVLNHPLLTLLYVRKECWTGQIKG